MYRPVEGKQKQVSRNKNKTVELDLERGWIMGMKQKPIFFAGKVIWDRESVSCYFG